MYLLSSLKCKVIARLLALSVACFSGNASANGWEHTAIPLAALISALKNEDAEIRVRAAHSLGHHHTDEVVQTLVAAIAQGESNIRVRQAVFGALARIGNPLSVPAATHCLETEEEIAVRTMCAVSLEKIRSPEAEKAAIAATRDSAMPVRLAAITSLGFQQTDNAVKVLTGYLQNDELRVRLVAIRALGHTRREAALAALQLRISPDTESVVLVETLKAIALIGSDSVSERVQIVLKESEDERVKRYALIALGSIDKSSVTDGLVSSLQSDNPLMQIQALEIAREVNDPFIVDSLIAEAEDYFGRFYRQSAQALESDTRQAIVDLSVINEFLRTVIALDPHHAESVFALAANPVDIKTSSPALITLAEGLYKARWQAIYGIGYTHVGAADEVIESGFNDKDSRLRAVATRSMGVNDPARFRSLALQALQDDVAEVRWQAATVLGRDKQLTSSDALVNATRDVNSRVREEAVLSLGYLGSDNQNIRKNIEQIRIALKEVLQKDGNARVRASASFALDLLGKS